MCFLAILPALKREAFSSILRKTNSPYLKLPTLRIPSRDQFGATT